MANILHDIQLSSFIASLESKILTFLSLSIKNKRPKSIANYVLHISEKKSLMLSVDLFLLKIENNATTIS